MHPRAVFGQTAHLGVQFDANGLRLQVERGELVEQLLALARFLLQCMGGDGAKLLFTL